jgi:multiple sugar transport system permease protein
MLDRLERARLNKIAFRITVYLAIAIILVSIVVPLVYIIVTSFKPPTEIFGGQGFLPNNPTLEPWVQGFNEIRPNIVNTIIVASGTALISLLITIPGAYAFGRLDFPGKRIGFYVIILSMLFPYILLIIPISNLWVQFGLFNTIPGLWIAYQIFITPFLLWILRDFFADLPDNLEDAAQAYGCSQFGAFVRVILPLSAPAIVVAGFLAFLTGWNDFLFINALTTGTGPITVMPVLYTAINSSGGASINWASLMAQVIIISTPPTVLYIMSQRYLSEAFSSQ